MILEACLSIVSFKCFELPPDKPLKLIVNHEYLDEIVLNLFDGTA